jgi:hypothetical protein
MAFQLASSASSFFNVVAAGSSTTGVTMFVVSVNGAGAGPVPVSDIGAGEVKGGNLTNSSEDDGGGKSREMAYGATRSCLIYEFWLLKRHMGVLDLFHMGVLDLNLFSAAILCHTFFGGFASSSMPYLFAAERVGHRDEPGQPWEVIFCYKHAYHLSPTSFYFYLKGNERGLVRRGAALSWPSSPFP